MQKLSKHLIQKGGNFTQIFELFGTVLLKDSGVNSQLDTIDKKAGSTSKSMGLSFGNIASAALKVASVIGLGMGIKDMVTNASLAEDRLAQMDAVLKSTGGAAGMTKDQLIALADAQGKLTTFSKGANEETENLLLTFTSIGKKVFPDALKTVNDMSQALGQDTKSSAIQLGKALNDPINGMTALKRVGVMFTDSQKEQIKTLQKSGDLMGAQKVILAELSKEFGGSAEAAGKTFGGQLAILKNQITGVGTSIMSNVMPYLSGFVKIITDNMPKIKQTITDTINFIVPLFQTWMKLIGQIVSELFPNFGKQIDGVKGKTNIFKDAISAVTGILKFAADHINIVKAALVILAGVWAIQTGLVIAHNIALVAHSIATGTAAAAQWILNVAMGANPIGAIILGIMALIGVVLLMVTHWQAVSNFFVGLWNGIIGIFKTAWDWLNTTMGKWVTVIIAVIFPFIGIPLLIAEHWGQLISFFAGLWGGIKTGFSDVVNFMISGINLFIKAWLLPFNLLIKGLDLIPGVNIPQLSLAIPNIPRFDVGTRYLPSDTLIQAHKGEMIVPKTENPYANSGGKTMPQNMGDMVFNFDMGGGQIKTVRLTSEQIAAQQRTRTGFKAVVA